MSDDKQKMFLVGWDPGYLLKYAKSFVATEKELMEKIQQMKDDLSEPPFPTGLSDG